MILQAIQQYSEILNTIATIIGAIVKFVQPVLTPIGAFMVLWINYLMQFFPYGNLAFYIVIFVILVIAGIILNSHWTGDKIVIVGETKDTYLFEKKPEVISEAKGEKEKETVEKCKECGLPIGQADICPYCGAPKKVEETSVIAKEEEVKVSEELKETPKRQKKKKKQVKKEEGKAESSEDEHKSSGVEKE